MEDPQLVERLRKLSCVTEVCLLTAPMHTDDAKTNGLSLVERTDLKEVVNTVPLDRWRTFLYFGMEDHERWCLNHFKKYLVRVSPNGAVEDPDNADEVLEVWGIMFIHRWTGIHAFRLI